MNSMNSFVVLRLTDLTSDFPSLTGVGRARRLLARLIEWSARESPQGTLLIDFSGVAAASASFIRESVLAFRDYARAYQPELFPVVANVGDDIREEFETLLKARREAILACRLDESGRPAEPEVLGQLEPGLAQTLEAIRTRGQLTLSDLGEMFTGTSAPTWSNRIANLIRQGFVVPKQEQNRRAYRFVLTEAGESSGP